MKTILVVEDECDVRKNLEELLETEGYKVLSAGNGLEGYKLAFTKEPDLILSDIRMPKMDGFELLEKLQENNSTSSIPFIFLTAKTDIKDMRKGMSIGADDYIIKPYNIDDVLNAIRSRFRKSEKHLSIAKEFKEVLMRKVPHELRTPLVGILGISEIISEDIDRLSKEELKEMVEKIKHSGERLHRRIEKFLIYAELLDQKQSDIINRNQSDTNFEIDSQLITSQILNKAIKFGRNEDLTIQLENHNIKITKWHFEILLNELIENSLKYSCKGSPINIVGWANCNNYILEIFDNGIWLKDIDVNKIDAFNFFGKEKATEEGLGMGLAIVKKIIELNQGYIGFKGNEEFSSIFEVGIPLAK